MAIEKREITTELQEAYIDYAMSVIVSRALPDVRDGMKPVQRRILWAMWDSGLTHLAKTRKSANVVGETMARYHPHGDSSIYDAMARMVQDWSLRYPLITGQGNFGCFTKDTKVKLTDGRDLSFGELVEEYKLGKKHYAYTVNSNGLIAVAEIKKPRLTKKNADLIKITLDNGEEIKCTPNHRFMLLDGSYKEAKDLQAKESLMPLYQKLSTKQDRLNRDGYLLIYQNKKGEWVPAHHLSDNYNLAAGKYSISAGRVRHHTDFNKLNNNPDNVVRIGWGDHWKVHYQHASNLHKNPGYREKIAAGRNKFWADPENIKRSAKRMSNRNMENWRNPEYRKAMSKILSEVNKKYIQDHPEKKAEFSQRATRTLKRLWQNPVYKQLFHEKIVAANKKRITNNTGKVKFLKICKKVLSDFQFLDKELYEQMRNQLYGYGRATSWETGLEKYYENDPNLILHELNKNHKVVNVELLGEHEDVYDLTIDKTHNFALASGVFVHNSIDGDSPAAMRYTEAKLSKISEEMLFDIEKETVDWQPNYDATRQEPRVLPAKLPNLLLNGTVGIAVGMATNIPPHNLSEVADAVLHFADNPDADTDDLLKFVKGPDFPTGGIIFDQKAIRETYISGRGPILSRAKADIQERKNRQFDIIITEIPYQVNKSELIKHMAELVQNKKIEGIRDIRDESDRDGLRIVVEMKTDVNPQKILNQLYQYTALQKYFHMNMIALADGIQPQLMTLKDVISAYFEHRKKVIRRRTEFDLKKAKERAHILEGLSKALSVIDKIIATIKKSKDRNDAHQNLVKQFKLSDVQASAILEIRLQTLAALERKKIDDELKEKMELIKELELILKSPVKIVGIIKNDVKEIKEKYGGERKTAVVAGGIKTFSDEDLVPEEEAVIALSAGGYIKRLPPDAFKAQKRGGKGLIGSDVSEDDFIAQFFGARTHDNILFFTDRGRVFQTKVYEIPPASRTSKGRAIHNFLELPSEENVSAVVNYSDSPRSAGEAGKKEAAEGKYLIMVTKNGIIKKTSLDDFRNIRRTGIIAIKLSAQGGSASGGKKGDSLKWVRLSSGNDQVILGTKNGQAIRFKETQARPMSRTAAGIRAIRLKKNDEVSGFDIIRDSKAQMVNGQLSDNKQLAISNMRVLVVMANGFGKQTGLKEYKLQNRGGSGIKTANITAKTGQLVATQIITEQIELLALSEKGQVIRTKLSEVRMTGRSAQGVRIMNLKAGDKVAGIVVI